MAQFHSHLSDKIDHYDSTTATHLRIFFQYLLTKGFIDSLLTTMCIYDQAANNFLHCSV